VIILVIVLIAVFIFACGYSMGCSEMLKQSCEKAYRSIEKAYRSILEELVKGFDAWGSANNDEAKLDLSVKFASMMAVVKRMLKDMELKETGK